MSFIVTDVENGSIAEKYNICVGDSLEKINGDEVIDYIDIAFFMGESSLSLDFLTSCGKEKKVVIHKEEYEDIGVSFDKSGLEKKYACRNKCLFCFVDQLPGGMRETLYFKDDDWRFSFLMGNYITLTNLSGKDISRIIKRKVSPLYVSVHAADDSVRKKLLANKNAGGIMDKLRVLTENDIKVHTQIVMCPGINDGKALEKTVAELYSLYPGVMSLAVVPVGLTGHRDTLAEIPAVDRDIAGRAIDFIEAFARQCYNTAGTRFVFASDEMYLRAERDVPGIDCYEDFSQIENGVGLIAKFRQEAAEALDEYDNAVYKSVSIATGTDFYPYMKEIAKEINLNYNINVHVYAVKNRFLGESVTVAGLMCGEDVISQLKGKELGDCLFLPSAMFRDGADITLDDLTLDDIKSALAVKCISAGCGGYDFIAALCEDK